MNLNRVDNLTETYKSLLENKLSVQERKVFVSIIQVLNGKQKFTFKDIKRKTGLRQNNHIAAVLTRLVKKGVIVKEKRGQYKVPDEDLINHINVSVLERNV